MAKDPVCGMEISEKDATFITRLEHETHYFCSKACQEKFETSMGIRRESGKKWWQKIFKESSVKPPKCH